MIKFFRIIRQNLISEGKTGQYIKYAIGEIVLVVIGILIALQITSWYENRATEAKLKNSLIALKNDLIPSPQSHRHETLREQAALA